MAELLEVSDQFTAFTVAIDKLDKIGPQGVLDEMKAAMASMRTPLPHLIHGL